MLIDYWTIVYCPGCNYIPGIPVYIQGAPHVCQLSPAIMLREGVNGLRGSEDGQEIS